MLRLLANRLLKKIAGRLESGTQTGEDEEENECGWRAKRDGSLPRDRACRRQQPCPAGSSARPRLRPSAAYLAPTGVANSKGGCHLSNASFDARRSARLPTAARPCAAISRERRTTTLAFAASKKSDRIAARQQMVAMGPRENGNRIMTRTHAPKARKSAHTRRPAVPGARMTGSASACRRSACRQR